MKHLIGAVHALAQSERICVLGSSALLNSFPELGEANGPLELTYDADLLLQPCDDALAALLHEAVGEGSLFARRTGYYADVLRPEIVETLSPGWESRVLPLDADSHAVSLAPEDLLVVKLRVGRPKDLELCQDVIRRGLVSAAVLRGRLDATPLAEGEITAAYHRLRQVTS